ncbi:hypothetical protein [Nocardia sp. NBC_01329]|uniref:hypothetical protein n=1 Tax=Nocardia sp. NBC_01329 TaxID=2903594 RepID=UPI002E0E7A60|nr:hypothetical protein OG405_14340 [Nocardia sp. NBC_01329]
MSKHEWDVLTKPEKAFMVNAYEIDCLAGVWGDLDEADQSRPVSEIAGILLSSSIAGGSRSVESHCGPPRAGPGRGPARRAVELFAALAQESVAALL